MGEGGDGGEGPGVGGGSHFAPGESLGSSSHTAGPGSGTIPWSVLLLIVGVLLAVWGVLSLVR